MLKMKLFSFWLLMSVKVYLVQQVIYSGGFIDYLLGSTFVSAFNQYDIIAVIFVNAKAANCSV